MYVQAKREFGYYVPPTSPETAWSAVSARFRLHDRHARRAGPATSGSTKRSRACKSFSNDAAT
jgi:hypothetical protein